MIESTNANNYLLHSSFFFFSVNARREVAATHSSQMCLFRRKMVLALWLIFSIISSYNINKTITISLSFSIYFLFWFSLLLHSLKWLELMIRGTSRKHPQLSVNKVVFYDNNNRLWENNTRPFFSSFFYDNKKLRLCLA